MEIAEVEVHPRPRRGDDDDGCLSGDDSPAIAIGIGQRTTTGGEINPLAPRVLRTPPSTEVEGGAHVNPVALDNEDRIIRARSPPRRNQSEIEIEPEDRPFKTEYNPATSPSALNEAEVVVISNSLLKDSS